MASSSRARSGWIAAALVVVAACGAPAAATSSPAPVATVAPTATPQPSANPQDALAEFAGRITAGLSERSEVIKSLGRAASLSIADVEIAVDAISEWAEAERAWLKDHAPDPCYETAYDAYAQGMSQIALGSISLKILLIPPAEAADFEAALEQINRGIGSADHALKLTTGVDCRGTAVASRRPTPAPDPAAGYTEAATAANRAYAALRSSGVGRLAYAKEWLRIERDARSRIEALALTDPAGADLVAAMDSVIAVLGGAAAAPTDAEAESPVGVAILGALPKQRASASSVREALDLPPLSDEDLL